MKLSRDVEPVTYMKTHAAELIERVAGTGGTVVITQNGKARVVVMDMEVYESWQDSLALLKLIAQSESELARGRRTSQARVFQRLRRRLDRRG